MASTIRSYNYTVNQLGGRFDTALAVRGVLMAAVSPVLVAGPMGTVAVYLTVLDLVKIRLFHRLGIG